MSRMMLRLAGVSLAGLLTTGLAPYAVALTLFNREAEAVRVTVIKGADRTIHTVAAGATLGDVCARGCILKLDDGSEWILDGSERVSIEGNLVYYDGPERPEAPAPSVAPPADGRAPRAPIRR